MAIETQYNGSVEKRYSPDCIPSSLRTLTTSVIGEMSAIAWICANIAGKNRYPDTIVEKNTVTNVSSLKLLASIDEMKENDRKSKTTGSIIARIVRLSLMIA